MANISCTADALLYASGSNWHSGKARQGVYSSTRYEGAIAFSGLSGLATGNIDITQIQLSLTFGPAGGDSAKLLTLYKATSNTVSGSVTDMRGDLLGAISVPDAFDRTETLTFNSGTNPELFAALKSYILAGGRVLLLYVPTTRGRYSRGYCYDYLSVTAAAIFISYSFLKSRGTLRSTSVQAGSRAVMDITAYNSAYSHRLVWTFGSYSKTQEVEAGETTAISVIPFTWLNNIPSASSGPATVSLETLNASGVSLGKETYSFTVHAGSNARPSISALTVTPVNPSSVLSNWGLYVCGKTRARVAVSAAGAYGSTIRSYSIELSQGCGSGTSASLLSPVLNRSGEITVTAKVVDTRGRSVSRSTTITAYPYAPPTFTSVTAYRCSSNGTRNDATGTYAYIRAVMACSSVNGNNSISGCTMTLSQVGGSYSTTASLSSGTGIVVGGGSLTADAAYRVTLRLTDAVGTVTTHTVEIPTAAYVMHIKKGGKAVGFGKAAGADNTASFGWPVKLSTPLEVSQGGTGSTTAAGACGVLGAVKKSGDTMTGTLNIQGGTNPGVVMYPASNDYIYLAYVQADANGSASIAAWDDSAGDTRRMLELRTKTAQSNMDYAFVLRIKENGSWTTHRIFHAGSATPIPIANGGTGASGAKAALTNLGIFYAASLPASGTDGQICLVPV